jgi:DNA-binding beta-propeller fold protein YncE
MARVPELHAADEFAGHRILGIAGRGGMGVVYRATQLDLDRPVALKLIAPQLAEDPDFRERFMRESRAAASIDHPNVIPIYYTGEHEGALYIAMRYVEGSDLRTLVRAAGRLEPERAAHIVSQVGSALDAAHARGIVHRDVKPANVLLGPGDHAYLTDFGLTKRLTSHTASTREGGWVGTLGYVAPEQIRGERADARIDVYALGCVLFHSLTGMPPYHRESDEGTLWAHLHEDPPSVGDAASARFDPVVARALAKDPDERYPSAGDLGRAALAAAGRPVAPGPERRVAVGAAAPGEQDTVGSPDQALTAIAAAPARRRRPWAWALAAVPAAVLAAVAVLVLGAGGSGGGARPGSTRPGTTPAPEPRTARVGRTVALGGRPNSVTVADGSVWVTRARDDRVAVISTATGRRRATGPRVGTLAAAAAVGFGDLWVANQSGPALVSVSLRSRRTPGSPIALPSQGKVVAVGIGQRAVWVGIRGTPGMLVRVDPRTRRIDKTITLPDGLQNLAIGDGAVWVLARRANTLTRVDLSTARQQSLTVGDRPADVAVGEGAVWVTNAGEDSVTRIDTRSLNPTRIGVGRAPQGLAIGGGAVWVANLLDSTLTRIDPVSGRIVGTPVDVDPNPYAIDVDGKHVWVGSLGRGTVQRIDFG